jgi:hypothetical protein
MTSDYTDDLEDERREADAALTRPDPTTTDRTRDDKVKGATTFVPTCPAGAPQWYGGTDDARYPDIHRDDSEDPRRPAG